MKPKELPNSSSGAGVRFEFGEYLADDATRQVLRGAAAVHLSPKAFDLLIALIRERPRVLPKAEIHARLWPNTFVSDASLAMVVAEVRAALGESARQPEFIRTVHRHGYAFQGGAREVPDAVRTSSIVSTPASASDRAPAYWLVISSGPIPLALGENIVGRDPNARVWLDAPSISRRHACIRVGTDGVTVEDLSSKNGTRVRGAAVTAVSRLMDGDELHFGSEAVTFRAWTADPTQSETDS